MRSSTTPRALAMITVAAGLLLAAPSGVGTAAAHGVLKHSSGGESRLRAYETAVLGPEHAAEHAAERKAQRRARRRWRRMSAAKRKRARAHARADQRSMTLAAGPADEVGAWTTAPFPIPNYGIHAVMLPTGKVMFWSYPPSETGPPIGRVGGGQATLWDPSMGTGPESLKSVPPPKLDLDGDGVEEAAPIYCSAQSLLPDGEVLIAGGRLVSRGPNNPFPAPAGVPLVFTFDPWSEQWVEQPAMEHGRFYPSQVELADGSTAILGGFNEQPPGGHYNNQLELFYPGGTASSQGLIVHIAAGDRYTALYPHLFTLPSGDVLLGGPGATDSALLDTTAFTWTNLAAASHTRLGGNAVLRPGGPEGSSVVTQIGGYGTADPPGTDPNAATPTTETIDAASPTPAWQPDSPLNIGRAQENTVLLPDGSMVAVGGGSGYSNEELFWAVYPDGRSRQVELYDPKTSSWKLGPPEVEDRGYHSTAVLLPDGRVFSAGDDYHPLNGDGSASTSDTAEIYSPPYLFKGPRPAIDSAPQELRYDADFVIDSDSPGLSSAVLVAPSATTHAADMNQRVVPLELIAKLGGTGLKVVSPPTPQVAPPGYYMLFLLDTEGVPSVARWVRLGADGPDTTTLSPDLGQSKGSQNRGARPGGSKCSATRKRLRKAHSEQAKRRLKRKLRKLGC